jgi:cell division transport system ATP-binding protein
VNLNIKKGRFCYLIGKTGSGKSSLLKTLYGHIPLASGHGAVVGLILPN